MSAKLLITRHGESEWNALGVWTGTTDVHLSEKGFLEAQLLGESIKNIKLDFAYCSQQIRSLETLETMLDASGQITLPFERSSAINERDYGIFTGQNKWQVQERVGEEAFEKLRRGWNEPVPEGETLKDVYERVVAFFKEHVLPKLRDNQTVLLVAHGNSIRSLIKYIESVTDEDISKVDMIFGETVIYTVDEQGKKLTKEVIKINTTPPPA